MITFQRESLAEWAKDIDPLAPLHYEELSLDGFKPLLFTEKYLEAEQHDILCIATMRDDGKMVGYLFAALIPHLHYADSGLMGQVDMYFVHPDYRKGNIGIRFIRFAEEILRKKGAVKLYASCKVHRDLQPLWEACGYRFSDKVFTKRLKEN